MPAKPTYSERLTEAADILEQNPSPWVDRRQLEEALGVSKTVAWRILRQCGAVPGPGGAFICERQHLIRQLRQLETDGGVHEREIHRRNRVEQLLSRVRPSVAAKLTTVASGQEAVALVSANYRKLPPNVELTRHCLKIQFSGLEEFLSGIGAVIYALHNDIDEIREWMNRSL